MTKRLAATQARIARASRKRGAGYAPEQVAMYRADELAAIFKMMSNPNRLKIVLFLAVRERSVGEMETMLRIRQPTLSQQIGELRDAALISGRRVAKSAIYALTADRGRRALQTIRTLSGAMSAPLQTLLERSIAARGSEPAAVFAAVFAANGEALTVRKQQPPRTHRRERPP